MAAKRQHKLEVGDEGYANGPERQCAVTRTTANADGLLRFVASPGNEIIPDLDRSLPGRGVWVTAERAIIEKAVASKAFSKSLKNNVRAASDLPDRVDNLFVRRALDTLALANKAGLVILGFEKIDQALGGQKAGAAPAALVHGCDAANDGQGKLSRKFEAIQRTNAVAAPICRVFTIEQLSLAFGRPSVVHAGLLPGGLTDRFLRDVERLMRYRASPDIIGTALLHSELHSDQRKVER